MWFIFLVRANERTNGRTDEGVPRGPRGPKKWKWEITNWSSTIKILNSSIPGYKRKSPRLLAKRPSRPLNAEMFEIQNLDVAKLDPSHHNSSIPPGSTCRAVCLLSSSLVQVTVKRGTSILVRNKHVRQLTHQMPNLGRQIEEEKLGLKRSPMHCQL